MLSVIRGATFSRGGRYVPTPIPPVEGTDSMTAASRTSGVAPLGVFFDAVDTVSPSWNSSVIQPRGFDAQPTNCTGVRITRVSISNTLGTGTLAYTHSGTTLSWRSGSGVDVSGGGNFTLTCSAGEIDVWVNPTSLPASNQSDAITIEDGGLNADWNSFHYAWTFGDAGSGTWTYGSKKANGDSYSKNAAFGWNAAHVYETAGSYAVALTVTDDEGVEHEYSQTITVSDNLWTTYYFATAGDDTTGTGAIGSPYKTWAKAKTLVGANVRLLFNRGDTFTVSSAMSAPSTAEPFMVGAYGSGDKPVLQTDGTHSVITGSACTNARYDSLHFVGQYPSSVGTSRAIELPGNNGLVSNCDIEGFYFGIGCTGDTAVVIYNTASHDHDSYALWASGAKQLAAIGCWFGPTTDNVLRTYADKVAFAYCSFEQDTTSYNYVRMMSSGASMAAGSGKWLSVLGCDFLNCSLYLQNDSSVAWPHHVRVEANTLRGTHSTDGVTFTACAGDDVCFVNNKCRSSTPTSYVGLAGGYNGNTSRYDRIRVLHNSGYYGSTSWTRFLAAHNSGTAAAGSAFVFMNNAHSAPSAADTINSELVRIEQYDSPFFTLDYNVFYAPSISRWGRTSTTGKTLAQFQSVGQDVNSATTDPNFADPANGDFSLGVGSSCTNNGTTSVARWCRIDSDGASRDGTPSIGCLE